MERTSGNAGQDFRTIAAALFGVTGSTAEQQDAPVKDSTGTKKSGTAAAEEIRKDKNSIDASSMTTMHPELTTPVVIPETTVQASAKQDGLKAEEEGKARGLQTAMTPSEGATELAGRTQIENGKVAAKVSSSALAEESSGVLPQPAKPGANSTTPKEADLLNGKSATEGILQRARKPAAEIATALNASTSSKKSTDPSKSTIDRAQQPGVVEAAKHESTPAPTVKMPTLPSTDTAKSDPPHSAAAAASVTPPPVTASDAQAKKIAENQMAEKAGLQSKTLSPTLAAQSRNAVDHNQASALSNIKERNNGNKDDISKDRIGNDRASKDRVGKDRVSDRDKDVRAGDSGKSGFTQTGRAVAGATNLGGGSKDGMGSPNNPAAQAKAGLVKPSAGTGSSATAMPDTDGPDEALPATTSLPLSAKFVQSMSGSEFRVGMQSQEFGSIDIRTSVARHMFSAQISVEHGDVAKSLATELPTLYSKLADQHVPVANIVIQGQSLASSSGFAHDGQRQQDERSQQNHGGTSSNGEAILPVTVEALDSHGRLDIRI
jgi:hypothetical protein